MFFSPLIPVLLILVSLYDVSYHRKPIIITGSIVLMEHARPKANKFSGPDCIHSLYSAELFSSLFSANSLAILSLGFAAIQHLEENNLLYSSQPRFYSEKSADSSFLKAFDYTTRLHDAKVPIDIILLHF